MEHLFQGFHRVEELKAMTDQQIFSLCMRQNADQAQTQYMIYLLRYYM